MLSLWRTSIKGSNRKTKTHYGSKRTEKVVDKCKAEKKAKSVSKSVSAKVEEYDSDFDEEEQEEGSAASVEQTGETELEEVKELRLKNGSVYNGQVKKGT